MITKPSNYDTVSDDDVKVTVGPHKVVITGAEDVKEKEYFIVHFDIDEGADSPLTGYYKNHTGQDGKWRGNVYVSYKETAARMLKHFVNSVKNSNDGYEWDFDEKNLVGKFVGLNFREEEYVNNKGDVAVNVKPFQWFALPDVHVPGKVNLTPAKLVLPENERPKPAVQAAMPDDKDLPF